MDERFPDLNLCLADAPPSIIEVEGLGQAYNDSQVRPLYCAV